MTESTKEFWEKAYQSNIGRLIGICYRYTKNHQLSEDLAHDAFLKAIDKAGTFKGKGKFEAWLQRIVVNHTLQYLRDRKKDPHIVDVMPDIMSPNPIEENIHSIESREFTTAELIETIGQLPEHHRLVFNLYILDEFTHAQIGSALGISEGTSKSHLARARKKLKELLTQKVEENQNNTEYKKALVLLLAGNADENMDQMLREYFGNFSILPQKPLSLESIQFSRSSFLKSAINIPTISTIVSIIIIALLIAGQMEKPAQKLPPIEKTSSVTVEKDPATLPSQTATNSQDSVIPERNLKLKPMKPLDSLALMLVLSSGLLNEVTAKDSIKNQIEKYSQVDVEPSADSAVAKTQLTLVNTPNAVQKESGTFRAAEVYWSEKNKEVYFKGRVRVDFKEQHFNGNGSFTFLGKVQLLIVDEQQVSLGKKLKLADADYELVSLDSKEATEKYGDKGLYGAVEISHKH